MDVLADSVRSSIKNLQEKSDFLGEQRDHYTNIRYHLLKFQQRSHDGSEPDDDLNGMVFGDIVISSRKIFLSMGYEYFVEKTCDEAVNFVNDKLNLMQIAIEQFNDKIKEANETLVNIGNLSGLGAEAEDEDFDESLPPVEIREELDVDGNVIKSSVTPTSSKNLLEPSKPEKKGLELNDFEKNLKGQLIHKDVRAKLRDGDQQETGGKSQTQIDMNNMYTFADLVRQMDEQDELEAQDIDLDEVDYKEYDDDENVHEDNEENFSMIPGMSAQRAFMHQINKLRGGQIHEDHQDIMEVKQHTHHVHDKDLAAEDTVPVTSILKQKSKKSKKKAKSVGFAAAPEIREVESLKEENRRNTHQFSISSLTPPVKDGLDHTNYSAGSLSQDGFDSELFAQLIGAQGPDEIHERYKEQMEHENESQKVKERKKRVSRFKGERVTGSTSRIGDSDVYSARENSNIRPLTNDLGSDNEVTRDFPEVDFRNGVSNLIKERIIHESPIADVTTERSSDVLTLNASVSSDIVERNSQNLISGKDKHNEVYDSILEREVLDTAEHALLASDKSQSSSKKSLFFKSLASLNKPRQPKNVPFKVDFSSLDNDSADEEEDVTKEGNKVHSEEDFKAFPKEILTKSENDEISVKKPIVDYQVLGESVDDMAKAYALGIYDDDIEDDPGVILERVEDFDEYNKQVELLKEEIKEFQISNPVESVDEHNESSDADELMQDVREHDIPANYSGEDDDPNDEQDDLGLEYDRIHESIAIEYSRLREVINSRSSDLLNGDHRDDHQNKQLEPIDEFGNPIKSSRFRSQRSTIRK